MKRKITLAIIVLGISAAAFYAAGNLQKNEINKQQPNVEIRSEKVEEKEISKEINNGNSTIKEQEKKPEESIDNTVKETAPINNTTKSTELNKQQSNTTKVNTPKQETKPLQVEEPNFIITDGINSKVVLSRSITFNGESAAQATVSTLDAAKISYRTATFGNSIYFSSINGIKERSAGASSGWCYFVNGKKLSIGAGEYKLNPKDKLEWKFLKDGLSE